MTLLTLFCPNIHVWYTFILKNNCAIIQVKNTLGNRMIYIITKHVHIMLVEQFFTVIKKTTEGPGAF